MLFVAAATGVRGLITVASIRCFMLASAVLCRLVEDRMPLIEKPEACLLFMSNASVLS